jgi:hypothetical protein
VVPLKPRASTRYAAELPITLSVADRSLVGDIQNLSLGGTCIRLDERLAIGSRVKLSFRVPSSDQPIEVDGEVRWSSDGETGIQFASLRARAVWDLNRYFETVAR